MKAVYLPNSQFTQLPWDYLHPNHTGFNAMGLVIDIVPFEPKHRHWSWNSKWRDAVETRSRFDRVAHVEPNCGDLPVEAISSAPRRMGAKRRCARGRSLPLG